LGRDDSAIASPGWGKYPCLKASRDLEINKGNDRSEVENGRSKRNNAQIRRDS
jgi:hypothetical protein